MGSRRAIRGVLVVLALVASVVGCGSPASSAAKVEPFGVANQTMTDAVVRIVGDGGTLNLLVPAGASLLLPSPDAASFGAVRAVHILSSECRVGLSSFFTPVRGPGASGADHSGWDLGGRWTISSSGIEPSFDPAGDWPAAQPTPICETTTVPSVTAPPAA
jgi:hypothetical protein